MSPSSHRLTRRERESYNSAAVEHSERFESPVIACGRGGSGTRILSAMIQKLDVFVGNQLNPMGDSIEWTGLLYEMACAVVPGRTSAAQSGWTERIRQTAKGILEVGWRGDRPWGWKLPETML